MTKAIFIFLFVSGCSMNVFPQNPSRVRDSLLHLLSIAKEDTNKVAVYTQLASSYYSVKPDSFCFYCQMGIDLARRLNDKPGIAGLNLKMASLLVDTGNYALALKYALESLSIGQTINSRPMIITSYVVIGQVYDYQADFVKSADYFFKALSISLQINDHAETAMIGTNLAAAFFNQADYKKAEEYSNLTIKEATLANAPIHIYKALYIMGMSKAMTGDSAAARDDYRKAIEICRKNSFNLNEAEVINDLSSLENDADRRIVLLKHGRQIYDSLSPSSFNSRANLLHLGEAYLDAYKLHLNNNDLQFAGQFLTLYTNKTAAANDRISYAQGLNDLAKIYELKGDYRKAYALSAQYHAINDSVYSQNNKNEIAEMQSRNEMDKKNLEIEKQKLQVKEQKKNAFIYLAALLLMAVLGLLFFRLSAVRKQKNRELTVLNKELDDANKLKARFFGILSHDLRSPVANLINFLNLRRIKPGALSNTEAEERENKISLSAQTLLETMESMLLWSKSQMQQFRPEKRSVMINSLFSYIQKNFASTDKVSFSFYCEENIQVVTDENYLKTIMYNLTANSVTALKNAPNAGIEWKAWQNDEKTYLSITDNGPGTKNEEIKALYDDSVISSGKNGLGLQIIRDLSKAIECHIIHQETNGAGASFLLSM